MAQDHYAVIGVGRNATAADIKTAYRRLVLLHHPDRSPTPNSAALFLTVTEAYETLGDVDKRRVYDAALNSQRRVQTNYSQGATSKSHEARPQSTSATPKPAPATIASDITRLSLIFTRGQYQEAERLANELIRRDQRQPIPYAVLGDLYRAKGRYDQSAMMYAYAAQMDPRNPVYQKRHEELISQFRVDRNQVIPNARGHQHAMTLVVGAVMIVAAATYIVIAKEPAIAPNLALISTWTLGLMVMLFLGGVAAGSVMCAAGQLDRFDAFSTNTLGRVSAPMIALTTVALVNFWAAIALYGGMVFANRGYSQVHLKFLGSLAAVTLAMALASGISTAPFAATQTLLWGGNLAYIGGLCGWMVADSFRRI